MYVNGINSSVISLHCTKSLLSGFFPIYINVYSPRSLVSHKHSSLGDLSVFVSFQGQGKEEERREWGREGESSVVKGHHPSGQPARVSLSHITVCDTGPTAARSFVSLGGRYLFHTICSFI